jgi:hypothetical protein
MTATSGEAPTARKLAPKARWSKTTRSYLKRVTAVSELVDQSWTGPPPFSSVLVAHEGQHLVAVLQQLGEDVRSDESRCIDECDLHDLNTS